MTEAIIAFLLVFIAVQEYLNRQERKKLIDAYLAKNLTELKQAEQIEKEKPKESIAEVPPDFIPFDEATDEQFNLAIRKELGQETIVDKAKETFKKNLRRANG
jgi:cbb3-type cytochrome oxidase subunit 3